jgi:hypothetical protein
LAVYFPVKETEQVCRPSAALTKPSKQAFCVMSFMRVSGTTTLRLAAGKRLWLNP